MRVTEVVVDRELRSDTTFISLAHCSCCGAPVDNGYCGTCLSAALRKKNCMACGAEAEAGARFCPECGRGM
jgi:hypothetical protein